MLLLPRHPCPRYRRRNLQPSVSTNGCSSTVLCPAFLPVLFGCESYILPKRVESNPSGGCLTCGGIRKHVPRLFGFLNYTQDSGQQWYQRHHGKDAGNGSFGPSTLAPPTSAPFQHFPFPSRHHTTATVVEGLVAYDFYVVIPLAVAFYGATTDPIVDSFNQLRAFPSTCAGSQPDGATCKLAFRNLVWNLH